MTVEKPARVTIRHISTIRANNNILWMHLLELALEFAPDQARATMRKINKNDQMISSLLKGLAE